MSDPDGEIVSYAWDYGDGTTSDGIFGSNSYASKGMFTVTLMVTDDEGATASDTLLVTIENEDPYLYQFIVPERALPGVALGMSAGLQDPGGLDTVTGTWDFGDGSDPVPATAPESVVYHVWDEPGTYSVTLRLADGDGGTAEQAMQVVVQEVTVDAGPEVSGIEGQPVMFTRPFDGAQYQLASVVWDFGDGATSGRYAARLDDQPIPHTYRDDGTYTVTVTMDFSDGAHESISDTTRAVIANSPPSISGIAAGTSIAGQATSLRVFSTDAGIDDVHSYRLGPR